MRKILFFLALCAMTCSLFAVPPQAFRYQAVVRDNTGAVVANTDMDVRVNILRESSPGTFVTISAEDHTTRSNAFGMINLEIGRGTHFSDSPFDEIDWGAGAHHVQLQIDIGGSGAHVNLGAVELLSVPYALFAANAGATGSADSYWERSGNQLRNINPGTVFVGGGTYPDPFPAATTARFHVGGSIGIQDSFLINVPVGNSFAIGAGNNIIASSENVFVLGVGNRVTEGENVLIIGENNRITGDGDDWENYMAILIGRNNEVESHALDNILIGTSITSDADSAIALGSDLLPSRNSIFIGRDIESEDPGDFLNIAMGHGITMYPTPAGVNPVRESILIGNNIASPGAPHSFAANRTIAIGNDIHPHGGASPLSPTGGHGSINIGNEITTRSIRSINIGDSITAEVPATVQRTIAIGHNITFPATTGIPFAGRAINHDGAIVIGTSFPGRFPNTLGTTSVENVPGAMMTLTTAPRPRFVVGGTTTWQDAFGTNWPTEQGQTGFEHGGGMVGPFPIPGGPQLDFQTGAIANTSPREVHFLYIDDFANAYFGFWGPAITNIVRAPRPDANTAFNIPHPQMPENQNLVHTGGTIFARQFVGLLAPATISDRELKTNITPIRDRMRSSDTEAEEVARRRAPAAPDENQFTETLFARALSSINVYAYHYNFAAADTREHWGFMAQDVMQYFPQVVQSTDGEILMMVYEGFIPILWQISQDQQIQITELQEEVSSLRDELTEIRKLLNQLMND